MPDCLLLSHGRVAKSLIEACEQILGECPHMYAIDCASLTPSALYEQIQNLIERENLRDGLFILVGLRGGSLWNAGCRVVRNWPQTEIISGLNLPMVLSFATKKDRYSFNELGDVLVHDGKNGISRLRAEQLL